MRPGRARHRGGKRSRRSPGSVMGPGSPGEMLLIAAGPGAGRVLSQWQAHHGDLANLASTILRLTGATSIAAALRHPVRQPSRPLETITNC